MRPLLSCIVWISKVKYINDEFCQLLNEIFSKHNECRRYLDNKSYQTTKIGCPDLSKDLKGSHVSISVNNEPLMFINYPSFYCIKTNISPDQLTNHATWCDFHN